MRDWSACGQAAAMNRSDDMKAWDGVDLAHSSHRCTTLAVGGDSETDLDATGGQTTLEENWLSLHHYRLQTTGPMLFNLTGRVLHTLVHGRAIPKSQHLAHEPAIIYARIG